MNVKDTYLIFFHTGKSQFVMDLQRYKNKWVKETRLNNRYLVNCTKTLMITAACIRSQTVLFSTL